MKEEPLSVNIRDLGLAAALIACGFEIEETDKDKRGRTYFIFQETASLDDAIKQYYSNTLQVKARMFFDVVRVLKDRIYADR